MDERYSHRDLTARYDLWYYFDMSAAKVTISIDEGLLQQIDRLVHSHIFPSRSQAVQAAVYEKIARMTKTRLAQECAKLDVAEEQALADIGLAGEMAQWPEY
jgi:Arc/MetJ-type ribon-helix-helix transcriptional regulator